MVAPAGASAGLSACFEQADVAIVKPPITASIEASLLLCIELSPFNDQGAQDLVRRTAPFAGQRRMAK